MHVYTVKPLIIEIKMKGSQYVLGYIDVFPRKKDYKNEKEINCPDYFKCIFCF